MTATKLVQSELQRFLQSPEPEVICLTGDWGVGKTFSWQAALDAATIAKKYALARYSYVSLFGLDSLEGLKLSLFENLEFLEAPPESIVEKGFRGFRSLSSRVKKLGSLASALPYVGGILSKAGPLYFSLIREQFVCVDDLERRGTHLDLRDVLGLVSYLREQRKCKVVLLLNVDALDTGKEEFDRFFEKVIDARLVFSPTALEAATIALKGDDTATALLRGNVETLGISNIRVIKKVERLIRQIEPLLSEFAPELLKQALHSITLFGWSKFQPTLAPTFEFLKVNQTVRYMRQRDSKTEIPAEEQKWTALLTKYDFRYMDEFDAGLLAFVDSGILDDKALQVLAAEQNKKMELQRQSGSYSAAWRPFHGSFDDNIEDVTRSIVEGMIKNPLAIGLSNLNESVSLLREIGRTKEAEEVIEFFRLNRGVDFWDNRNHLFGGSLDPTLQAIVDEKEKAATPVFEFEQALIEAGKTYDRDLIAQLTKVSDDEYYRLIKTKKGDDRSRVVLSALEFRKISNATDEMREVVSRMEKALKKVGSESVLNAARVRRYGV